MTPNAERQLLQRSTPLILSKSLLEDTDDVSRARAPIVGIQFRVIQTQVQLSPHISPGPLILVQYVLRSEILNPNSTENVDNKGLSVAH